MADGGGFYTSRFNNPNLPTLKNNRSEFNARNNVSQTREHRGTGFMSKRLEKNSEFGGKNDVYRHEADMSRVDGGRGNHIQSGQANIQQGYNNRDRNFSRDVNQGYNRSYLNANNTSSFNSLSQQQHGPNQVLSFNNSFQIPPAQNMPPFAGVMSPGTGNSLHQNSFPDASSYVQNPVFSDTRQFRNTGTIPFPPPMYDTQGNICMPPPPPMLPPPPLPNSNQASYAGNQGLMPPTQVDMVLPPNLIHGVKEHDNISKSADQEWVDRFAEERGYTDKGLKRKPKVKVGEARHILQKWLRYMDKLTSQRDKLVDLIKCEESEWQREMKTLSILKEKLLETRKEFSTVDLDSLNAELQKTRKKRKWQSKRKQSLAQEKLDSEKKKFELHLQIDHWRENEIAKDQAKNKAASVKQEAGGLLGEIRRKQNDASKSLNLLQALTKLRKFRKQEAELKGVYPKPVAEQNKYFNEKVAFLEKIMKKHHELYESEEKTLVVMLAEEEEEKEREKREKNQRKQLAQAASSDSSDPLRDFYRYYTQADNGLGSLVHIRHGWDMYIVPDSIPGSSYIPQGPITAVEPSSDYWASMVKDKG